MYAAKAVERTKLILFHFIIGYFRSFSNSSTNPNDVSMRFGESWKFSFLSFMCAELCERKEWEEHKRCQNQKITTNEWIVIFLIHCVAMA